MVPVDSAVLPADTSPSRREVWTIFGYFAALTLLLGLAGSLSGLPIGYFLKDKLKLSAQQSALFGTIAGIPGYIGFVFGFIRDRWKPWGRGDRGYMLLTAPLSALCYVYLAFVPLSYERIMIIALLDGCIGGLAGAAFAGLLASVAQTRQMTGRLTAARSLIGTIPGIVGAIGGGYLTEHVAPRVPFLISAALLGAVAVLSLWRPREVFDGQVERAPASGPSLKDATVALLRHRPLWPVALVYLLWDLMPGWGTPLFYYLSNTVKLTPTQMGTVFSTVPLCTIFMSIGYGLLCRQMPLRKLLWLGMGVGIIGAPSAMLMHSFTSAIVIFALAMLSFGLGNAAMRDLLVRSYPKGMEGTGATLLGAVGAIAAAGSNQLGAWIYDHGGFGPAMLLSTLCTAAILPVLPFIPRSVTDNRDGEIIKESMIASEPGSVAATATA